jgi:hypothetical protein
LLDCSLWFPVVSKMEIVSTKQLPAVLYFHKA